MTDKGIIEGLKKIIFALGCCATVYSSNFVKAADPYMEYGAADGRVSVNNIVSQYSSNWGTLADNSINNWNNSANVEITKSSSSENIIKADRYNDTWYGVTTQYYNNDGETYKFTIKINARL